MFHLTFLRWIFWGIVKYVVESLWFDHFTSPYLHVSQIWCAVKILTVGSTSPQNSTTPLVSKHALKLQQSRTLYGCCLLLICTCPNHLKHDSLILSSTGSNIDFLIHTHPNPIVSFKFRNPYQLIILYGHAQTISHTIPWSSLLLGQP